MRLFIDLDTRGFVESAQFQRTLASLALKRRDRLPIDVQFLRSGLVVGLADGATGRLGLKADKDFNGPFVASDLSWEMSGSGDTSAYRFDLDLNTVQIDALFAGVPTPTAVTLMLEVEWTEGDSRTSSHTLPVSLENDVVRGDEGIPLSGTPIYPAPVEIETTAHKGAPAGYAPLDSQGRLPAANMPAHGHQAAEVAFETQAPGTGNEWSPADGNDVAARANEAFHSVNFLWNDHNDLHGRFSGHVGGFSDRHSLEQIDGLQSALNAKANAATLGNYVQRTPAASNFRFKDGSTFQLWNETTSKWHTVFLTGPDGAAQLTFASTGEA